MEVKNIVVGPIFLKRDLCQRDLLSLHLFILFAEWLSNLFTHNEGKGFMINYSISGEADIMFHLRFANDNFIFFRATEEDYRVALKHLSTYRSDLGQIINKEKLEIFFSNNVIQEVISNILGVTNALNTGRYLGLLSLIG